jgi:hypothetical protein
MSKPYKKNKVNGEEPVQKVKISDLKFNVTELSQAILARL